ncbi:Uncharacterized conserved protein UCP028846 [Naviculisporaceae sp. PSN 640]
MALNIVILAVAFGSLVLAQNTSCPDYTNYSQQLNPPLSAGNHALPYQRPPPSCRTFNLTSVESALLNLSSQITDPDLSRLFVNTLPNTLDTAIKWHGVAGNDSTQELTFLITGDIDAMWLRDSANQLLSYISFLTPDPSFSSLASLYRGVINLQARYLLTSPYCNSFQPPWESGLPPSNNSAAISDSVRPSYDPKYVFECKYELDSLASFLQISSAYFSKTGDAAFFTRYQWVHALRSVIHTAKSMMTPTYDAKGRVLDSPYTFTRQTTRATETLANDGLGSPVARDTGLIRSAYRPSDDSCSMQLFIPGNMMFVSYLGPVVKILEEITGHDDLVQEMEELERSIKKGIEKWGVVSAPKIVASTTNASDVNSMAVQVGELETETIYAYEVDGYGSSMIMDDANIPSLLSAPLFGYLPRDNPLYLRTRKHILANSKHGGGNSGNPYFMNGPLLSAVGGPHAGPGMAWPMASIVRILTSDDDEEIMGELRQILASTGGLGLIHESVNSWDGTKWTRPWFSWANGLFGQMILDLAERKPHILRESFQ